MTMLLFYVIALVLCLSVAKCENWTLVWSDEFDGDSVDLNNWDYSDACEGRTPSQPWGNHEAQCYSNRSETVQVKNGWLILKAIPLDTPERDHNFTSGKLIGKKGFTYGRFEARLRMPEGKHLWPAFWMLPKKFVYGGTFAASGEIDIMELRGDDPHRIESTIHFGGTKPDFISMGGYVGDFFRSYADDFHTYGCLWTKQWIRFYVDDLVFHSEPIDRNLWSGSGHNPYTKPGQPFDQDFQINLNLAVSGWFFPENETLTVDEAKHWKKSTYEIDWVRVYQQAN